MIGNGHITLGLMDITLNGPTRLHEALRATSDIGIAGHIPSRHYIASTADNLSYSGNLSQ